MTALESQSFSINRIHVKNNLCCGILCDTGVVKISFAVSLYCRPAIKVYAVLCLSQPSPSSLPFSLFLFSSSLSFLVPSCATPRPSAASLLCPAPSSLLHRHWPAPLSLSQPQLPLPLHGQNHPSLLSFPVPFDQCFTPDCSSLPPPLSPFPAPTPQPHQPHHSYPASSSWLYRWQTDRTVATRIH